MKDNLDTSGNQSKHLITMNEKKLGVDEQIMKDFGSQQQRSDLPSLATLSSTDNTPIEEELIVMVTNRAIELREENSTWRYGQAMFNALHDINPTMANKLTATEFDPFYDDSRVVKFMTYIINHQRTERSEAGTERSNEDQSGNQPPTTTTPTATPVAQRGEDLVYSDVADVVSLTASSSNSIRFLTALLSGKRLARKMLNDDNCIQILWCEWFKEKPYFYVSGWGSAFGNAMDRVIGIIETNGDGWCIDSPNAQVSDTTMPNRSSEPLLTKSNTGGEEESQTDSIGDFVPLVWEIEKLRRGGNCIMNELIERVKENFKGLAGIKHRYIEYNKTPQSNTGGEQHQDKAGEELFHWVKASERLPESGGYYFVRMGELKDKYVWPRLKIATLVEDNSSIEWLEKMPQGQSVQVSDTRGATSKDEPLPPSPPHQGEGELEDLAISHHGLGDTIAARHFEDGFKAGYLAAQGTGSEGENNVPGAR